MEKLFKVFIFLFVFTCIHGSAFAQIECKGTFSDGSPRPRPADPVPIPIGNVQISSVNGGPVSPIQPNTQYRITVTQPVSSDNSFWVIPAGDSFGVALFGSNVNPQTQDYAQDRGPGVSVTFTLTTDNLGGIIVFDIRGGSGGGFSQTCRSDFTRIRFF